MMFCFRQSISGSVLFSIIITCRCKSDSILLADMDYARLTVTLG